MIHLRLQRYPRPGPVGAAIRFANPSQPKPFIDEVAMKSDGSPFWRALNQLLVKYLRSNEAKKRATATPARATRTVPEDYMILRYMKSYLFLWIIQ